MASVVAIPKDWREKAKCAKFPPDEWFPDSGGNAEAKRVCLEECPVRRPCGHSAVKTGDRWGIAAGFQLSDPDERADLRRYLGLPTETSLCRGRCGRVDVAPVRRHVAALKEAGMPHDAIAAAAQVAKSTVYVLSSRSCRWRTIVRDKADRILAIPVPEVEG